MPMFFNRSAPTRNIEDVLLDAPQPQQSRSGLFGGGFGRALRSLGGAAKDAFLGGDPGRDPNIFDFIIGGFGPSGAMGHVGGIRERAREELGRRREEEERAQVDRSIGQLLGAPEFTNDPVEAINREEDREPMFDTQTDALLAALPRNQDTMELIFQLMTARAKAQADSFEGMSPEEIEARGYRPGTIVQRDPRTGEEFVRQSPLRPNEDDRNNYPDDGYDYFE